MKKLAIIGIALLVFIALTGQVSISMIGDANENSLTTVLQNPLHTETWYITSDYGLREDPINGGIEMHYGVDIGDSSADGTTEPLIYSAEDGEVISAYYSSSYGNTVVVNHGDGLATRYAHLDSLSTSTGALVTPYSEIGIMGNTGDSTGIHLHFEVTQDGEPVNPNNYVDFN